MIGRLQIQVLGELAVRREGELLPLPQSKKTRALLGYLATVGRPQRREHLCRLLWELPDDPRASLRWSLHKIRQITDADGHVRLTADRRAVALAPNTVDVDFAELAHLSTRSMDMMDTAFLESLASRFGGDFLEGLSLPRCPQFEAWRQYHRDDARRLRIEMLRRLVLRHKDDPERARFYSRLLDGLGETAEDDSHAIPGNAPEPGSINGDGDCSFRRIAHRQSTPLRHGDRGAAAVTEAASQDIRFCRTTDGVRIAYAICGEGPPIVRAAHWMSHLQYDWESPVWRHWIDTLSRETTLIRYDERGNGLSDWNVPEISFQAMVADLESVVDAAGLDRFTLLGVSQSCAVSVAYAVRNPQRLSGLILYGGFVKGWRKRDDPHDLATHEAMTTLIREGWGRNNPVFRHLFTRMFIPSASPVQMDWFDELQRIAVSPDNAARLHEAFGEIDVTALQSQVRVPTLVLHARHDAAVPVASSREFSMEIPNARFVDLDSRNHILLADEPAFERFATEVKRFVAETR